MGERRMGLARWMSPLCLFGMTIFGCQTPWEERENPPLARGHAVGPVPSSSLSSGQGHSPLDEGPPPLEPSDHPLPINLATALKLANARPLDVQIAGKQVEAAMARYDQSRLWWLPSIVLGVDYFLHTGPQQNFEGLLPVSNRNTLMAGFGPNVVFAFSEGLYAPLAARQEVRASQALRLARGNDAALDVAEAYFSVQQARGELAAALTAVRHADLVARKAEALAKGLAPPAEANRARAELARRKQIAAAARERWRVASAELARLLRLTPSAVLEPAEPPSLPITLIDPTATLDTLILIGLTNRPELAGHQAVVQATLARLKQEEIRPLVPSLAIRSVSTNPSGLLGYGAFGGGRAGTLRDFAGRFDIDVQLFWEFQALGFGNRARVKERRAEYEMATLELFRTQDRIAAEVASAFARVRATAERVNAAEPALRDAVELVNRTVEGLGQTRRVGDSLLLVVRPQEAVAAVQAFGQAASDFFEAVADYNRAQFQLYRALGQPGHCWDFGSSDAATKPSQEPMPELLQVNLMPELLQVKPSATSSERPQSPRPRMTAQPLPISVWPGENNTPVAQPRVTLVAQPTTPASPAHSNPVSPQPSCPVGFPAGPRSESPGLSKKSP